VTSIRRLDLITAVSVIVVALAALAAIFGPLVFPDATRSDILSALEPAGVPGHLLGTDHLGRDVLQLAVVGARSALVGPLIIAIASAILGLVFGSVAGWLRGGTDFVLSRTVDVLLSLPVVLVAIVVAGVLGSGYWLNVALLAFLFLPSDFRLVRATVIEQRNRPYVEAAQLGGTGTARTLVRHVLPNVLPLELANFLVNFAFAIVSMASLSFLGLGVRVGAADWGLQLNDAQDLLGQNSAAMLTPAVLTVLVACAVNLLGDRLGDRVGGSVDVS
jgi:peptide/nickel transport system permease protein